MFSTAKTYRILVFVEDTKSSAVWNLVWKAKASQKFFENEGPCNSGLCFF